ncbi:MAG: hypothetical protein Fues2KO_46800 [Fuerstiella sp.]
MRAIIVISTLLLTANSTALAQRNRSASVDELFSKIRLSILTGKVKTVEALADSDDFNALFSKEFEYRRRAVDFLNTADDVSVAMIKKTETNPERYGMTETQLSTLLSIQMFEFAFTGNDEIFDERQIEKNAKPTELVQIIARGSCLVHLTSDPKNCTVSVRRKGQEKYQELEGKTNLVYGFRYGEYDFRCVCGGRTLSEKSVVCEEKRVDVDFSK